MDNNQCHCNLHCIIIDWLRTVDPHATHSFLFKLKARLTRYDCKSLTKSNKTKILPTLHGDIPLRFLSPYPPPSTLTIWWFLNTDHRLVSLSLVQVSGRWTLSQRTSDLCSHQNPDPPENYCIRTAIKDEPLKWVAVLRSELVGYLNTHCTTFQHDHRPDDRLLQMSQEQTTRVDSCLHLTQTQK